MKKLSQKQSGYKKKKLKQLTPQLRGEGVKLVNSKNEISNKISSSLISYREQTQLNTKIVKEFAIKTTTSLLNAKLALMSAIREIEDKMREMRI